MEIIFKFLSVAGLAVVELWAAIPAGIALGFHPLLTGLASAMGAMIGAALAILLGDKLRNRLLRKNNKKEKKNGKLNKIWDKYGVVGLGLLSPLLTGALLGATTGVSFGAEPKRLMLWLSIGIVLWTALLTTLGSFGVEGLYLLKA